MLSFPLSSEDAFGSMLQSQFIHQWYVIRVILYVSAIYASLASVFFSCQFRKRQTKSWAFGLERLFGKYRLVGHFSELQLCVSGSSSIIWLNAIILILVLLDIVGTTVENLLWFYYVSLIFIHYFCMLICPNLCDKLSVFGHPQNIWLFGQIQMKRDMMFLQWNKL